MITVKKKEKKSKRTMTRQSLSGVTVCHSQVCLNNNYYYTVKEKENDKKKGKIKIFFFFFFGLIIEIY